MFDAINKWLDGKKTILGGLAALLTGIGSFITDITTNGFQMGDLTILGAAISAAMLAWGLGNKLNKLNEK